MTPAEIDTELARLWATEQSQQQHACLLESYLKRECDRRGGLAGGGAGYLLTRGALERQDQIEVHLGRVAVARSEALPYEQEFERRGGWARYFLVQNTGGHIHRDMHCTTCYVTTRYSWLIDLADKTETDLVAAYGDLACTVCFPSAPVMKGFGDGTSEIARWTESERAERAAAKDARATAKAAKTLDAPVEVQTRPGRWTDTVTTVYGAKQWIKDTIDNTVIYDYGYDAGLVADGTRRLSLALADKGIDTAPMIAKWTKAAEKEART